MKKEDKINEFKRVISAFAADFELELSEPEKYNISNFLRDKSKNEHIIEDIDKLSELDFMLRHGEAEIILRNE